MASRKPNNLAVFVTGTLIGFIRNAMATLNWVVSCWDNIEVGTGLEIAEGSLSNGKPKINLAIDQGDGIEITDTPDGRKMISATGEGVTVVGTDGSSAEVTGSLTFASADDSNVKVSVAGDGSGNATVTIGVYYK